MPASSRNVVAPVNSSPARIARWTGDAPRQAGSSEKCRLTQPVRRDVENRLRQQGSVRDDRAAVRGEGAQLVLELRLTRAGPG